MGQMPFLCPPPFVGEDVGRELGPKRGEKEDD